MVISPKLEDYDINVLVVLGNQTEDVNAKNNIKELIVEKVLALNYKMLFLINKFVSSERILKEVYAKVILMRLVDEYFNIDDSIVDEILSLVSLDDLAIYGSNAFSLEIRSKCEELFWVNASLIEDASELNKKNARYRRKVLVNKLKEER